VSQENLSSILHHSGKNSVFEGGDEIFSPTRIKWGEALCQPTEKFQFTHNDYEFLKMSKNGVYKYLEREYVNFIFIAKILKKYCGLRGIGMGACSEANSEAPRSLEAQSICAQNQLKIYEFFKFLYSYFQK
jgi:hypothetical protein